MCRLQHTAAEVIVGCVGSVCNTPTAPAAQCTVMQQQVPSATHCTTMQHNAKHTHRCGLRHTHTNTHFSLIKPYETAKHTHTHTHTHTSPARITAACSISYTCPMSSTRIFGPCDVCVCVCVRVCVCACSCVCVLVCLCAYECVYILRMWMYIYLHIPHVQLTDSRVLWCVCACVCVCVCVCLCVCLRGCVRTRVFVCFAFVNIPISTHTREVGGWGRDPFSRNLMSPTPRRKWYLTTGRRFH